MNTITLAPATKQLYQMQTQNSHPRISLRRVLWMKFLRYVDKTPAARLSTHVLRAAGLVAVVCFAAAPSYLLGIATAVIANKWLTVICAALAYLYGIAIVRVGMRMVGVKQRNSNGNQNTYNGLPIDELATYIIEQKGFQREHAVAHFCISRKKQAHIAKELEAAEILRRGENNGRILHEKISREELVRQLRDKFPLKWNETQQVWQERGGIMERWAHDTDRKEREERERIERLTRRRERLQEQVAEQAGIVHGFTTRPLSDELEHRSVLQNIFAHA